MNEGDPNWPDPPEDPSHPDASFYDNHELHHFRNFMHNVGFEETEVEMSMKEIGERLNEPLKGMLVSQLSEIQRVHFVTCVSRDLFVWEYSTVLISYDRCMTKNTTVHYIGTHMRQSTTHVQYAMAVRNREGPGGTRDRQIDCETARSRPQPLLLRLMWRGLDISLPRNARPPLHYRGVRAVLAGRNPVYIIPPLASPSSHLFR